MGQRGRPKGSKSGPQSIIFIASALSKNDQIIFERIEHKPEEGGDFTADEAREIFYQKHQVIATHFEGPFRDKKGGAPKAIDKSNIGTTIVAKQIVISDTETEEETTIISTLNEEEENTMSIPMGDIVGEGIFDSWKGTAFAVEGQDEKVFFLPVEHTTGSSKNKPQAKLVEKSLITFN